MIWAQRSDLASIICDEILYTISYMSIKIITILIIKDKDIQCNRM